MGAAVLQIERLGPGRAQRGGEIGHHERGPAQLGEQQLLRIRDQAFGAPVPHLRGGHEQARIGRGLEEELQDPVGAVAGLVLQVVAGVGRVVQRADLGEPEARPPFAGRARADLVPLAQRVGERRPARARPPRSAPSGAMSAVQPRLDAVPRRERARNGAGRSTGVRASRSRTAASVSTASASSTSACGSAPRASRVPGLLGPSRPAAAHRPAPRRPRHRARGRPAATGRAARRPRGRAWAGRVRGRRDPRPARRGRAGARPTRRSGPPRRDRPARPRRPPARAPSTAAAPARCAGWPRALERTSSGEATGPPGHEGSSSVSVAGLPGCRAVSAAVSAANGCGRAERSDRADDDAGRSPSSAHSSTPRPGDQTAWTASTDQGYGRAPTDPRTRPRPHPRRKSLICCWSCRSVILGRLASPARDSRAGGWRAPRTQALRRPGRRTRGAWRSSP